ncbi:uroporphyrinogen-III synthase [Maritimibacter sp. UBA3975]|uniref:uroporphyrinogen-III synthase n=1 Tax=Maritimibacter sp. UBA3975 TaxID=1946833 RepID=UPI0025C28E55|nr:uroporphyrinogen-III synthase [Maritimibacter sp. UBA3975]
MILTRPEAASTRVAAELSGIPTLISPVTQIAGTGAEVDLSRYRGVILTSANAVTYLPSLQGIPVYSVGARTAEESGGVVQLVARDAGDLVNRITATGPLVHAHGQETRGNIASRLTSAGIETHSVVVYVQLDEELSQEAKAALGGDEPTILPLWSARSAQRLFSQNVTLGPNVHLIALSPAVADVCRTAVGHAVEVCDDPDGQEMIARIVAAAGG